MSTENPTNCAIHSRSNILSTFGDRLKEAFESPNIADLGRKMGVSFQAAKNYVEGRIPSAEKLIEISRSTGCSIDWLLTGEGSKYRSIIKTFDIERSIEIHDDWRDVMSDWFAFEGKEMPDTMGASFMGGWESFSVRQKIEALKDFKMLLDRIVDGEA